MVGINDILEQVQENENAIYELEKENVLDNLKRYADS